MYILFLYINIIYTSKTYKQFKFLTFFFLFINKESLVNANL